MKQNIIKLLVTTIAITSIFGITKVNAQSLQDELYIDYDYQWWVATYNFGTTDRVKTQEKMIRRRSDNAPVYCIQADIKLIAGTVNGVIDEDTMISMTQLTKEQMDRIRLISYYGYGYGSHTAPEWYYATQMLIWQITNPGYIYAIADNDSTLTPSNRYDSYYNEINSLVDNHTTQPSFYGQKVEMVAGNTVTLTDTNGVLSKYYEGVENDNVSAKIEGNNLVITAKKGYEGVSNPFLYVFLVHIALILYVLVISNISLIVLRITKKMTVSIILSFALVNVINYVISNISSLLSSIIKNNVIVDHLYLFNIYEGYMVQSTVYNALINMGVLSIITTLIVLFIYRNKEQVVRDFE